MWHLESVDTYKRDPVFPVGMNMPVLRVLKCVGVKVLCSSLSVLSQCPSTVPCVLPHSSDGRYPTNLTRVAVKTPKMLALLGFSNL